VIDGGNQVDWGKTSLDYSTWRPNYPDRFYALLKTLGIGVAGQRILDLGTGVGFLALRFAENGALVTGIDIAQGQIDEARRRSADSGIHADFLRVPAEDTGLPSSSFDVIAASQSWLYFETKRAIAEVKRLLAPDGVFFTSHLAWLPRQDSIAKASEELVLRHNPKWSHAAYDGEVPLVPKWSVDHFTLQTMFVFDEALPFTRESWRGRFRACRAIGATLSEQAVASFDREHDQLLSRIAGNRFTVLHRVDAHVFQPKL